MFLLYKYTQEMKTINLLTWNLDKLKAAQSIFSNYNIELIALKPDIEEIQGTTSLEIAKHTAKHMSKTYNKTVLREDHALYIRDFLWGSFPWPYTSYFDKYIDVKDLVDTLYYNDRDPKWPLKQWYFELWCCYIEPNWRIIELVDIVEVEISRTLKWERWNLDKILMIKGSWRTFAECIPWENLHYFTNNFKSLADQLIDDPNI